MIEPQIKFKFEKLLNNLGLNYSVLIEDVGLKIRDQITKNEKIRKNDQFDYGMYHPLNEINRWMNQIQRDYPNLIQVFNVTQSYEGRSVKALKISSNFQMKKPAIFFDAGIHAREWISPATLIFMTKSLVSNYTVDPTVTQLLDFFDFYIVPVFNVDGYQYTWTFDRLWRKTRSVNLNSFCIGVDANRNWDSHFCESGSSTDPCSETYCGEKAFSEREVKGVADFLLQNKDTIVLYINFHSYSQLWMSPWAYTTEKPNNFEIQDRGSIEAINALYNVFGTEYNHGNVASTIYVASGAAVDWAYEKANILFSYTVELRNQDKYGFLLPPDQIIPSGIETFEAVKALALYVKSQNGTFSRDI
ncbi:unnamed protein product [Brachionus calyciflorus]|uniref:Peptidase M14 domain-containing protein n=1 Tax=Brachionus calyciflorus TaxID=104777 RepID=A0A813XBI9_9BILA|nr:unnamed protein product [Brachionus calyciflorus]